MRSSIAWSANCSDPCSRCACCRCVTCCSDSRAWCARCRPTSASRRRWSSKVTTPRPTRPSSRCCSSRCCTWCATPWITASKSAAAAPHAASRRLRPSACARPRQGEHVVVEVSDDGARHRCRSASARWRGSATSLPTKILDAMSDAEAIDLIFAPGFSTAVEVTDLSGRGVGMDAVRTAVERFGGRVASKAAPGRARPCDSRCRSA